MVPRDPVDPAGTARQRIVAVEGAATAGQQEAGLEMRDVLAALDQLPEEPDAWYDHQLVGLNVVRDGVTVGKVLRGLPGDD